jgi:hypothetical protein
MLSLRYESWPVAALSRACGTNTAQPELPAKPGYGQQSDSHRDSDIKARAVSKIVSNKADVHPDRRGIPGTVGGRWEDAHMTGEQAAAVLAGLLEREEARLRLLVGYTRLRDEAQAVVDNPGPVVADGEILRHHDGCIVEDEEIRRQAREVVDQASRAIAELLAA